MPVPGPVSAVQRYVGSPAFRAHRTIYVLTAIDRLVERVDVFPVWEGLALEPYPTVPVDFIIACSDALAVWERMPRRADKAIESDLAKLAADAESLSVRLDQHADEIRFCGIPLLLADYLAQLSNAQRVNPRRQAGSITVVGVETKRQPIPLQYRYPFSDEDGNVAWPVQVQSLLRELAKRMRAPDKAWRSALRPTKRGAKDAERTFLVRSIAYFFRTRIGKPHWDWVARAVAAMTDSSEIDAGHAQKLVRDIRPLWASEAEERLWELRLYPDPEDDENR